MPRIAPAVELCSILPVKVLNDEAQGTMDTVADGIVQAADASVHAVEANELHAPVTARP